MKFLLVVATVVDGALAALLVGVSGFWFGGGPESMHAGALAAFAFIRGRDRLPRGSGRWIYPEQERKSDAWSVRGLASRRGGRAGAGISGPVLGRRHESVCAVLALNRSHARIRQVEANKFRMIGSKAVQQLAARRYRLIR